LICKASLVLKFKNDEKLGSKVPKSSIVTVIIIFLNAADFLQEAIESIFAQTYAHWELLLVDDGSTDGSTEIAHHYAEQKPDQVRYLNHPGYRNCGKGASRNLGILHARGSYLAFLDADDIWLPNKLEEQVGILAKHEKAGMLYGKTLYWYSWTQDAADSQRDFSPKLGIPLDTPINQPDLLPLYLRGKASIPCPSSILVRRSLIDEVDGFDETFIGVNNIYEDQAFYAKLLLKTPVLVVNRCWDMYRQHSQASMAVAWRTGTEARARRFFLRWLEGYLHEQAIQDPKVWLALKRELWLSQQPKWLPSRLENTVRWFKKWVLRIEECSLPTSLSYQLWKQK
jgi:glycosyltransferase involved in cell wall biosynthesis